MGYQRGQYKFLKDKWTTHHQSLTRKLWEQHGESLKWLQNHTKHLVVGSISSLMLFALPGKPHIPKILAQNMQVASPTPVDKHAFLITDLSSALPDTVSPLNDKQEKDVAEVLERYFRVSAVAELDGKRLNRSYGLIGAEQHLMRYPGDTMGSHFDNQADSAKYYSSGMAPGRGAWGYFGTDQQATEREKYYIAVQTFLAPGWDENPRELYSFFKYRKMLVVNPQNGKAMVAVIGDAGPAPFTGKHLGGSPEVMKYLERVDGAQKGPVVYFFLDDPENKIPLGPIDLVE